MGDVLGTKSEGVEDKKKDPVVERAEAALKRIDSREDDRLEPLEAKKKALDESEAQLKEEQKAADLKATPEDIKRSTELSKLISKINEQQKDVQKRIDRVKTHADKSEARVLKPLDTKVDRLDPRGEQLAALRTDEASLTTSLKNASPGTPAETKIAMQAKLTEVQGQIKTLEEENKGTEKAQEAEKKRAAQLVTLRESEESLSKQLNDPSPTNTDEAKNAIRLQLTEVQGQIKKLEAQVDATEKIEEGRKLREELKRLEARDDEAPLAAATAAVDALAASGEQAPAKNEFKGMFSKMGDTSKNLALSLANEPRDPNDAAGNTKLAMKRVWMRFVFALSPQAITPDADGKTWDQKLSDGQREMLKDAAGMEFIHNDDKNLSTIKWGPASKEFAGVPPGAQRILEENFGDNWYLKFKTLKKTDTVTELKANVNPDSKEPDDIAYNKFVTELEKKMLDDGADEKMPVLQWLNENSAEMDGKVKAPSPGEAAPTAAPETAKENTPEDVSITIEDAAQAKVKELGLRVENNAIVINEKRLLVLVPGLTGALFLSNGAIKLRISQAGQEDNFDVFDEAKREFVPEHAPSAPPTAGSEATPAPQPEAVPPTTPVEKPVEAPAPAPVPTPVPETPPAAPKP